MNDYSLHLGLFMCIKIHSLSGSHVAVISPLGSGRYCSRAVQNSVPLSLPGAGHRAAAARRCHLQQRANGFHYGFGGTQNNVGAHQTARDRYSGYNPLSQESSKIQSLLLNISPKSLDWGRRGKRKGSDFCCCLACV